MKKILLLIMICITLQATITEKEKLEELKKDILELIKKLEIDLKKLS